MPDIPGDTSTSATITVGASVNDQLDFNGDHDWFRISLSPGTYQFDLRGIDTGGGTLYDPYLYFRDSSGALLDSDDDGGFDYDSRITYTVTSAGNYYLDAGAFANGYTGTYTLTAISLTPGYGLDAPNISVPEGDIPARVVQVQVSRDASDAGSAATFYGNTTPGTATPGQDYAAGDFVVSFAAGQTTTSVSVVIVGDTIIEPNKTFNVNIFADAAHTDLRAYSIVTILNDDGQSYTDPKGNDTLYAISPGVETLAGGAGNDTYLVNSYGDQIIEGVNGGYDTVYANVSYALNGGSFVESLSTQTHAATDAINLIGNFHDQLIIGNYGDNVLNGNGGADTLIGLYGNDTYVVGDATAQIIEADGQGYDIVYASVSYALGAGVSAEVLSTQDASGTATINLTGNEFGQLILGNAGANVLDGGLGSDTLVGLGGADTFAFSTALGASNVDTVVDFASGSDHLQLSSSVFTGLAAGTLAGSAFVAGTQATSAGPQVIYDQANGALFFDADGTGAGAAVQFAQFGAGTALVATDMIVVV